jgi:hypothetical protein
MNKSRLLYVLVAANVLLAFASVGVEGFFGWTLPHSLAEYNDARFAGFSPWSIIRLPILAGCVLTAFAGWIGLVTFWRFGRPLYLVSCAFGLLLILVSGPSVTISISAMLKELNGVVSGIILGLIYFSDLARRFERAPLAKVAPSEVGLGANRA